MRAYSSDKDSPTWKKEMGKAGTFDLVLENENMYGIIILFLPYFILVSILVFSSQNSSVLPLTILFIFATGDVK